ncbi:MAG TPA: OmpW family outer membrane protein [Thermoanaerobaculia bacterium]|nr:OmpW family outer membrane protein [Thermoanaerobaculia bacterium]
MKSAAFTLAILLAAPLVAQERDMQITAWASQVEMQGEDSFPGGLTTDYDDGFAMGISINGFVRPYLSLEGSVFSSQTDAALLVDGVAPISLGKVSLTPILFGVQLHLPEHSRFDPYIGAGAAYVLARNLSSPDLLAGGSGRIELDDEIGYYLNAGIGVRIAGGLGLVVDGRYIPYETTSRSALTGIEQDLDFSPRLLSVGLRLRF